MSQTVKCLGCGRKLKAKASVAQQRGPRCQAKHAARIETALNFAAIDLAASYTDEQVDKAIELIEQNAIAELAYVPRIDRHLYLAVSSDGAQRYNTTADTCTCKAGQYGRRCYHRAAALVLDTMTAAA